MQGKLKLKTRKLILYIFAMVVLFSLLFSFYAIYSILDVVYVNYDYKVQEARKLGFNADTDALHFGIIFPGGSGQRDLILKTEEKARVLIKVTGDNVTPNRNNFILEPSVETKVQFSLSVPLDTLPGNYSGKIRVIFKRA